MPESLEKGKMGWFFLMLNGGYTLFAIVKKFTFKMLWTGSCIGFMFVMPAMFEMMAEQEAVLDKIQRDDLMSSMGGDMGGLDGGAS